MTRKQYEEKTFDELVELLREERYDFHSRDDMKEFAKHWIGDDDICLARHILDGMDEEWAEYYLYDYTLGTFGTVYAVTKKEDFEHLIDE